MERVTRIGSEPHGLSDAGAFGAWKGVESLRPEELLRILSQAARLKTTMRHCYTEEGRRESVADHSWRIALIAMLMTGIEEYQDFDMDKVIRMCCCSSVRLTAD